MRNKPPVPKRVLKIPKNALLSLPHNLAVREDEPMRAFPLVAIAWLCCFLVSAPAMAQQMRCNPCSHPFGKVQIGTSSSYTFQISNTGDKTLKISSKVFTRNRVLVGLIPDPDETPTWCQCLVDRYLYSYSQGIRRWLRHPDQQRSRVSLGNPLPRHRLLSFGRRTRTVSPRPSVWQRHRGIERHPASHSHGLGRCRNHFVRRLQQFRIRHRRHDSAAYHAGGPKPSDHGAIHAERFGQCLRQGGIHQQCRGFAHRRYK